MKGERVGYNCDSSSSERFTQIKGKGRCRGGAPVPAR